MNILNSSIFINKRSLSFRRLFDGQTVDAQEGGDLVDAANHVPKVHHQVHQKEQLRKQFFILLPVHPVHWVGYR
jgi:hypothetical protein